MTFFMVLKLTEPRSLFVRDKKAEFEEKELICLSEDKLVIFGRNMVGGITWHLLGLERN